MSVEPLGIVLVRIDTIVDKDATGGGLATIGSARQRFLSRIGIGIGHQAFKIFDEAHASGDKKIHFCAGVKESLNGMMFAMGQRRLGAVGVGSIFDEDVHKIALHAGFPRHIAGGDEGQGHIKIVLQRVVTVLALMVDDALNDVYDIFRECPVANGILGNKPEELRNTDLVGCH